MSKIKIHKTNVTHRISQSYLESVDLINSVLKSDVTLRFAHSLSSKSTSAHSLSSIRMLHTDDLTNLFLKSNFIFRFAHRCSSKSICFAERFSPQLECHIIFFETLFDAQICCKNLFAASMSYTVGITSFLLISSVILRFAHRFPPKSNFIQRSVETDFLGSNVTYR